MSLKYANGSDVICDNTNGNTHGYCALAQSGFQHINDTFQGGNKVYDWRQPGMIDYFVHNITGPFIEDELFKGIFFDDIYTICEIIASAPDMFPPNSTEEFCAATMQELAIVSTASVQGNTLPILSVKGDETDATAFNMTKYTELVAPNGKGGDIMAYFEYWAQWPGQPRNEAMLNYSIEWGKMGVPMQMHSTLIFGNYSYPRTSFGDVLCNYRMLYWTGRLTLFSCG